MTMQFPERPYIARASAFSARAPGAPFSLLPPFVHGRPAVSHAVPDIPSINEFLDHLPPIEDFAPDAKESHSDAQQRGTEWESWGGEGMPSPSLVAGEKQSHDWRDFDWGSAGRLSKAPPDAAAESWASTDWEEPRGGQESRQSAAEALARALDQIARRIRAGELRVPSPETVKDDAAIAATLAALLGIKR